MACCAKHGVFVFQFCGVGGLAIVHKRKEERKEGDRKVEAFSKSRFVLTTSTIATSDSFSSTWRVLPKTKHPVVAFARDFVFGGRRAKIGLKTNSGANERILI
jgi:hypothetical protein